MSHVFEIQLKSQGRIVIPMWIRRAMNVQQGDWVVVQVDKIDKEENL